MQQSPIRHLSAALHRSQRSVHSCSCRVCIAFAGERRHSLLRYVTAQEGGQVGTADGGAPQ